MAGGLYEAWEGEVVETLENLFQMCKMREMTELGIKVNKKREVTTSD